MAQTGGMEFQARRNFLREFLTFIQRMSYKHKGKEIIVYKRISQLYIPPNSYKHIWAACQ